MVEARMVHVERIHAQVREGTYEVDAHAVAEALLQRLLVGRSLAVVDPVGPAPSGSARP